MTEEYVSGALYRAALVDPAVDVLSWQSVDGKGYFAADVKLRLPDKRRFEPDLILLVSSCLWLIEVKGTHDEVLADEVKLVELLTVLGRQELNRQVSTRIGRTVDAEEIALAAAFYSDAAITETGSCEPGVIHLNWDDLEPAVVSTGLAEVLQTLRRAAQ